MSIIVQPRFSVKILALKTQRVTMIVPAHLPARFLRQQRQQLKTYRIVVNITGLRIFKERIYYDKFTLISRLSRYSCKKK
ncbi:hypothetical protein YA21_10150 [Klebsiella aerogenes]|nr:hypothetical protein YA21_10150 [Klebsiella aerogenes]KTJ04238.1 hypothetical protein ASU92_22010 [Klebsiella aerogenes]